MSPSLSRAPLVAQNATNLRIEFAIDEHGSPTYQFRLEADNNCDPPANFSLFIQQQGDTLTAAEPYKQWWSAEMAPLKAGAGSMTVPLNKGEKWLSVFGERGARPQPPPPAAPAVMLRSAASAVSLGRGPDGAPSSRQTASVSERRMVGEEGGVPAMLLACADEAFDPYLLGRAQIRRRACSSAP